MKNILPAKEVIFSNPVIFYPIAEGEITGSGNITIEAVSPLYGDYAQLPPRVSYSVVDRLLIQLMAGFTYRVTGWGPEFTVDIAGFDSDRTDFLFQKPGILSWGGQ